MSLAAAGTPEFAAAAAVLGLLVGLILVGGGIFRLGWIADLLSVPVTTGFLAGIAVHIIVSQLPGLLGIPPVAGSLLHQIGGIAAELDRTNVMTAGLGLTVLLLTLLSSKISARIPGALIGLAIATGAVLAFDLEDRGVAVLGIVPGGLPHLSLPLVTPDVLLHLVPAALIVAVVVMVQTAATTRSFPSDPGLPPDVNRDFVGIGAGSLLAGFFGSFPVNASPPMTATVAGTGGRSQIATLVAASIVLAMAAFGTALLTHVPQAALAGVLVFIGMRIIRLSEIIRVYREALGEFTLIILTMIAIILLPIQTGVAVGIMLSLLHGIWSSTRARAIEFVRVPRHLRLVGAERQAEGGDAAGNRGRGVPGAALLPQRL